MSQFLKFVLIKELINGNILLSEHFWIIPKTKFFLFWINLLEFKGFSKLLLLILVMFLLIKNLFLSYAFNLKKNDNYYVILFEYLFEINK